MTERTRNRAIWIVFVAFALFSATKPWLKATPLERFFPAITILAPLLFVLLHGPRQIGWRRVAGFFAIAFVVSWIYETLSIATGFPFGAYHYSDRMGPKLGEVPVLIMPAYFAVCYLSWHLARLLLDRAGEPAGRSDHVAVPLVASFVMVMWDMSMDPARATIGGAWIWHDGGAYFGVPFSNFMGWFLCVWTVFVAYSLLDRRMQSVRDAEAGPAPTTPRYQVIALYGALFLEFAAYAAAGVEGSVKDPAGQVWQLRDIHQSLGLVSIFTMLFVTILAFLKVRQADRTAGADTPRERVA